MQAKKPKFEPHSGKVRDCRDCTPILVGRSKCGDRRRLRRSSATILTRRTADPSVVRHGERPRDDNAAGGLVGDDFYAEEAGAGAVEFAEEDALPAAELELAFGDEDGGGSAHERGFDVGVGVAFGVSEIAALGNQAGKGGFEIGGDVGVGVFVDDDAGGGVRDVEMADAGVDAGVVHEFGDGGGDVEQLGAALGADVEFAGAGVGGGLG